MSCSALAGLKGQNDLDTPGRGRLRLVDGQVTSTGVILATYASAA